MASRRNQVLPLLGNLLEWYDFAIYGYLALPLGEAFFSQCLPISGVVAFLRRVCRWFSDAARGQPGAWAHG
jgi:hypothetical protein